MNHYTLEMQANKRKKIVAFMASPKKETITFDISNNSTMLRTSHIVYS